MSRGFYRLYYKVTWYPSEWSPFWRQTGMKIQTHGWMKSGWFWRKWMGKHWDSNHLLLWMCLNFHVFLWYIWSLKTWYVCLASRNARSNDALNVFSRVFSCKRIAVGKAQALRPCIFLGYPQCDRFDTSETMDLGNRFRSPLLRSGKGGQQGGDNWPAKSQFSKRCRIYRDLPNKLWKISEIEATVLAQNCDQSHPAYPCMAICLKKTVDLLRQFFPVEPCDTEATNTEYPQRVFGAPRVKRFDERQVNYRKTVISKKCSCFLHLRERIFPESWVWVLSHSFTMIVYNLLSIWTISLVNSLCCCTDFVSIAEIRLPRQCWTN